MFLQDEEIPTVKTLSAILIFWCSILASAQVKISVPGHQYKSGDRIDVAITNIGTLEVTFCVNYGNFNYIDHHMEETFPSPVDLQEKGLQGWGTLVTPYDVSPQPPKPVTLHSGESQHFPFRVNTHGTVRLVLVYGFGSNEQFCEDRKNMRVVASRSRDFSID